MTDVNVTQDRDEQTAGPGSGVARGGGTARAGAARLELPPAEQARDVGLIALDMDGTLARTDKSIPEEFFGIAEEFLARGVIMCAASGRQRASLQRALGELSERMLLISENGSLVASDGEVLRAELLEREVLVHAARTVRDLSADGRDVGLVAAGVEHAYVERSDREFREMIDKYYADVEVVDDLTSMEHEVIKLAAWDGSPVTEAMDPALQPLADRAEVVRSQENWVDLMRLGVSKGSALTRAQQSLGIPPERCAAFGDHLNDLQMLDVVGMPFAVANAEPEILRAARYTVPSNDDEGVIQALRAMLDA